MSVVDREVKGNVTQYKIIQVRAFEFDKLSMFWNIKGDYSLRLCDVKTIEKCHVELGNINENVILSAIEDNYHMELSGNMYEARPD